MRLGTKKRAKLMTDSAAPVVEDGGDPVITALLSYREALRVFCEGEQSRKKQPGYIILPDRRHPSEVEREVQLASYVAAQVALRDAILVDLGFLDTGRGEPS